MTSNTKHKKTRHYLPSEERKKDLLDAALIEFSEHGYSSATMAKIAARAGLSKAGIYAHYKSKDEMLEDLLVHILKPSVTTNNWLIDDELPLAQAIDNFISKIYEPLENPKVIAMIKLIFLESDRAKNLIRRWRDEVTLPHLLEQQKIIDACISKGLIRDGIMSRHFYLAMGPLLIELQQILMFGKPIELYETHTMREIHRELLLELLTVS
ncbi:hypothetical protein AKN90_01890 [Thiopseudomonas alkaliphila]|uniref:TetR/AcrR family transcriptional regulator n=1 Tax=Thiopseudomonas alkaliphila TaxID=1697053 RepID=UPI00069DDB86|nr:TetR/AcrR family transcriptional regulator [Thiopseudomonas alkaliphila]AKX54594.1 hypothetical protein AKN90_01890 [Thiopseudomonas alkaliphila]